MLAHDGIVFTEFKLLGRLTRILFRHVEKAGASGAEQLDKDSGGLSHDQKTPNAR